MQEEEEEEEQGRQRHARLQREQNADAISRCGKQARVRVTFWRRMRIAFAVALEI